MNATAVPKFVSDWVAAWNSHDVERLLEPLSDDVVFTSPVASQLLSGSDGIIRGKQALRDYWTEGLRRIPDLHFEVINAYVGVDILVINYRNQRGGLVCEVLLFDGDVVRSGHGTYVEANNPAGATA
jgi:ketosteroid isomerase-like protein